MASGVSFGALILFLQVAAVAREFLLLTPLVWLQEAAPTALRGSCGFLAEVSLYFAIVVGMASGMDVFFGRQLVALLGRCAHARASDRARGV